MANLDEWTVKANDAMEIALFVKAEEGQTQIGRLYKFKPTWTYPIVGDQETIFGYKDLKITLRFNASDMRPHLSSSKSARFPEELETGEIEVEEIHDLFNGFLPQSAFGSGSDFVRAVESTSDDWHPPGELIQTFEGDKGSSYEVWKGNLSDPLVLALLKRVQILVSLFIEGGTPIATESTEEHEADPLDRWTIFFLYEKRPRRSKPGKFTYVFAGYSTVYRFFVYRPTPPGSQSIGDLELPMQNLSFSELPCRSRISQFIIIEPFQHKGNGQRLYSTIYDTLLKDPSTFEITVEDPNEAFDVLRDRADLTFLRKQSEFKDIEINRDVTLPARGRLPNNIIDRNALEATRLKFKIAPRQFSRLTEMHLMSKLPDGVRTDIAAEVQDQGKGKGKKASSKADEYVYRLWRLVVKSRLNAQNKEQLATLEPSERIQALEETLNSVELEYSLLLSMIEQKKDSPLRKRKLSDDADVEKTPLSGKKRRVEKALEETEEGGDEEGGEEGEGEGEESEEDDDGKPKGGGLSMDDDDDQEEPESEKSKGKFVEQLPGSPDVELLSD